MKRNSIGLLFLLLLFLGACSSSKDEHRNHTDHANVDSQMWTCSMHPQIMLPESGDCPICGMDLIPAETDEAPAAAMSPDMDHSEHSDHGDHDSGMTQDDEEVSGWACAMNCVPPLPEAGPCPVCGMKMVPVGKSAGGSKSAPRLKLSPAAIARAGIQTSKVRRRFMERDLWVPGEFAVAEDHLSRINTWVNGRITKIHGARLGENIKKGHALYDLYSPELLAAQRELHFPGGREAAQTRLRLWGVSQKDINAIIESGETRETLTIRASAAGTVLKRHVEEGAQLKAGSPLFELADLSHIWAQLQIDEIDLAFVTPGTEVIIHPEGQQGTLLEATIESIDPFVQSPGRTARARVVLNNRSGQLRPGQLLRAQLNLPIKVEGRAPLAIPESAVLFTGERNLVYVQVEPGKYEAREVHIGPRGGEWRAILHGLEKGDLVVNEGAFRIDSALQIRGQASLMQPAGNAGGAPAGAHHGH